MSRAQRLAERLAGNMNESLGVRLVPTPEANPTTAKAIPTTSPEDGRSRDRMAGHMEIERIVPDPEQPRKFFSEESITQLAASLKKTGQLQPIRVRWNAQIEKWVIISGERRYRAAIQAGFKSIACQFCDKPLTEAEILQESLVENLLREDLRPIEAAQGYQQLITMNNWTIQQVADALNISKGAISKTLSLLKLPEDIQNQIEEGVISASTGYEVSRMKDEEAQRELANRIVTEGLKRDETGQAVGKSSRPKRTTFKPKLSITTKYFVIGEAKIAITWQKESVSEQDIISILQQAIDQMKTPLTKAS